MGARRAGSAVGVPLPWKAAAVLAAWAYRLPRWAGGTRIAARVTLAYLSQHDRPGYAFIL